MKRIIALITVASALALSGCSSVGVAASVGSTKITQATVQKSIDEALAQRAKIDTAGMQLETGAAFNRNQLRFHLISVLLGAVSADGKMTITKSQIDARRAQILTQIGGAANLPKALVQASIAPSDFDQYILLIIQSEQLSAAAQAAGVAAADTGSAIQKLIIAKAAKLKVTVNPRYGKWDPASGDVVATDAAAPAVSAVPSPASTK